MDEVAVPGFEAAERLVEWVIAGLLVPIWLLALAAHLARPYQAGVGGTLVVRLARDIWSTLFGAMRDGLVVVTFLASFIYFYPDLVIANEFPITGGVAGVLALAVLVLKLVDSSPGGRATFRAQSALLGLGAALYVAPYVLATQLGDGAAGTGWQSTLSLLAGSHNRGWALGLCALSQEAAAILAAIAVIHTLRAAPAAASLMPRRTAVPEPSLEALEPAP